LKNLNQIRYRLSGTYGKVVKKLSGHGLENNYILKSSNKILRNLLKTNYAEVEGQKMILDSNFSYLSFGGSYEPMVTDLVKKEVKEKNIVLDLGANIGYYTLLFSKLVGNGGKVFAFEPGPENFALLKKNVEMNKIKNVVLEQKACSKKTGKAFLYRDESPGRHTIYRRPDGTKYVQVEVISLDDYFKNFNKNIDFVKMDIQGSEGSVIQGMSSILKENQKVKMVVEFSPWRLKMFDTEPKEFLGTVISHGFKIYNLDEKLQKIQEDKPEILLEKYTPENHEFTDLFLKK